MIYMHGRGYAHLDLKPSNLLLDASKKIVKVADFGLAVFGYDRATGEPIRLPPGGGTLLFQPPEVLIQIPKAARQSGDPEDFCPFAADVWAMGLILYFLLNRGHYPFGDLGWARELTPRELANAITRAMIGNSLKFHNRRLSYKAKSLVLRMLHLDSKARPEMWQIYEEPWLVKIRKVKKKNLLRRMAKRVSSAVSSIRSSLRRK